MKLETLYCSNTLSIDGKRLCTCGGDSIIRVIDPASKIEIISKKAPEVLQ